MHGKASGKLCFLGAALLVCLSGGDCHTLDKNRAVLMQLLDQYNLAVHPHFMAFVNDEFIMFLSTIHVYRAPRSHFAATEDEAFRVALDPGRLYDYRRYKDFALHVCGYKGCDTASVIVHMMRLQTNDSHVHVLGVEEANVISLYSFMGPTSILQNITIPMSGIVANYKPFADPIEFGCVLLSNREEVYLVRLSEAKGMQVMALPEGYSYFYDQAIGFFFLYSEHRIVSYNRQQKAFSFYGFKDIPYPDETTGAIPLIELTETDSQSTKHASYFGKIPRDTDTVMNLNKLFVLKEGAVEVAPTADIDEPGREKTYRPPFDDQILDRKKMILIALLVLCVVVFAAILWTTAYYCNHKHREEEVVEKTPLYVRTAPGSSAAMPPVVGGSLAKVRKKGQRPSGTNVFGTVLQSPEKRPFNNTAQLPTKLDPKLFAGTRKSTSTIPFPVRALPPKSTKTGSSKYGATKTPKSVNSSSRSTESSNLKDTSKAFSIPKGASTGGSAFFSKESVNQKASPKEAFPPRGQFPTKEFLALQKLLILKQSLAKKGPSTAQKFKF